MNEGERFFLLVIVVVMSSDIIISLILFLSSSISGVSAQSSQFSLKARVVILKSSTTSMFDIVVNYGD